MNSDKSREHLPEQWFALRVKSRCEKLVSLMARNKGFEEFLPLYHSRRQWSDRSKSLELPLFPGYVFCRLNPEYRLPLLTIPGALHFVGIGRMPIPIDEAEVAAIKTAVQLGLSAEPWPYLEAGQRVRIEAGALAGVEGFLVEARKQYRVVVSISLLQRAVAIEIDRNRVTPLDASGRSVTTHSPVPFMADPLLSARSVFHA